jgi:hypothetical protein
MLQIYVWTVSGSEVCEIRLSCGLFYVQNQSMSYVCSGLLFRSTLFFVLFTFQVLLHTKIRWVSHYTLTMVWVWVAVFLWVDEILIVLQLFVEHLKGNTTELLLSQNTHLSKGSRAIRPQQHVQFTHIQIFALYLPSCNNWSVITG